MKFKYIAVLFVVTLFFACKTEGKEENPLQEQIAALKSEFAPDKRVALLDIEAIKNGENYILKGESNLPEAVRAFREKLTQEGIDFVDSIQLLPRSELEERTEGLVNISVANLRSKPKHSAELATQATLGTPVKIYKRDGDWFLIQTPDKYLSWVDAGGIVLFSEQELNHWKAAKKIIYTKTYGHSFAVSNANEIVSDLVAGSVLETIAELKEFYVVRYPDLREALIAKNEAEDYDLWLEKLNPSADALVETSKKLMGVPYLWGGTSTKGMDCSGFTKTIYFLNGMVIPRDASQQVHTGKTIDSLANFENLDRGDLLFFGRKATDSTKEKVVHVGMWIGNNEFIHASEMVRVSSMDKNAENFDEYNLNRYLRTKRILKEEDKDLIDLKQISIFK